MKIVIAGAGEVGTHLAKMLSKENQDITLIDNDQNRLDVIDSNYNLMTWNGSPSSFETLHDVSTDNTDLFIAVTPYETRNISSCAIAKQIGARKTVARIDNCEFLREENMEMLKNIGVDFLIYPENIAALEIAKALKHNWARYWREFHDGKLLLIGVKIHGNSQLLNVMLKELPGVIDTRHFHIAAIKRNSETIIPNGNDEILPDDIVYFITMPPYTEEIMKLCGKSKRNIKKALIMGGSRIARRFARLYHDDFDIKIIDSDMANCEYMATELPDCEIVCGDGRDMETLRDNNIYQYDAFLALTDASETNILACMTAKDFGVPKTIAEVENLQFLSLAENLNIGSTINKKLLASSRIYKILLDEDKSDTRFFALPDAEVAELQVEKGAKITRSQVRNLKLPYGMTLAALVRNEDVMLVNGATQIREGDYVVVFSIMGTLQKIQKWFS